MRDGVHLITYPHRLGGSTLADLARILDGPLEGLFRGVHVLPFYVPFDGADAGFDPVDHTQVDPRLGTWEDVRRLARGRELMADLIVNHISADSVEFRRFLTDGDVTEGMFLTYAKVFPDGAREEELTSIYRPRPGLPFSSYGRTDGTRRLLWTTFTPSQIDLDTSSTETWAHYRRILSRLASAGVSLIRLDAAGYAVKEAGTSCFMIPATGRFLSEITGLVHDHGAEALVELHAPYRLQTEAARHTDLVYDFCLPALALHALYTGEVAALMQWWREAPADMVTVLDTHDGIGVVDVGATEGGRGLLGPDQVDALVEGIHRATGGASRQATGAAASNLDVYQVNTTYYDAVGCDPASYLLARVLQFFAPGIPQVYYVGLLAGHNDLELLKETGNGRDINRHRYTRAEVELALRTPVVQALVGAIRLRNGHAAFGGRPEISTPGPGRLRLAHRRGGDELVLDADLGDHRFRIRGTGLVDVDGWEDLGV